METKRDNTRPAETAATRKGRFGQAVGLACRELDRGAILALSVALALVAVAAVLAALAPVALKWLIDTLSGAGVSASNVLMLAPAALLIAYVGAQGLSRLAGELRMLLFGLAEQRLSRRLALSVFNHVMALPLKFHLERQTGAVGQTVENGLMGYRLILQHTVFTILPGLLELLVVAIVLASFFDSVFLAVFAVCALAYGLVFAHGARQVLTTSREVSSAKIKANAQLTDALLNFETVKLFTGEAAIAARYDRALAAAQQRWRRYYVKKAINGAAIALIFAAGLGAVMTLAIQRVQTGAMTIGDFVLVNTYMLQIIRPLELLGFGIRDLGQGAAYVEKLLDLNDQDREPEGGNAPAPARAATPATLAFEDVRFGYQSGRQVLHELSFALVPGGVTALVGPSGAGKSSILRLLTRSYEPDGGEILLDGTPISEIAPAELRRLVAVVPQDVSLFNASIAENIGFPLGAGPDDIERAARLARLDGLIASLPERYDTVVGERGLKLSGGEKQRLAIARAALREPRLYVFDEPTSSLDSRTEEEVLANIAAVAGGVTTLVVAHRLSTIAGADRIIVLEKGRVRETGRHTSLLAQGGLYAEMWRAQTQARAPGDAKEQGTAAPQF